MRRFLPAILAVATLAAAAGFAAAQAPDDPTALAAAKAEADEANRRSASLERQAAAATSEAERARAEAAAVAARIEAAEADISAAEARIRIIDQLQRDQRARLAEKQAPAVRLAGALQVMARRPAVLALVQPGSMRDVVHVRSLLAATLPVIRARTASLRAEVDSGNRLKADADRAYAALVGSRETLRTRRIELARLEERQRRRSEALAESALAESDRALAFNERARDLSALIGTRGYEDKVRRALETLPEAPLRPALPGETGTAPRLAQPVYLLPLDGRLVTGTGELSEAGVHARGLTFEAAGDTQVVAPAPGRVVYAAPFRSYGHVVIIDHGSGWMSTVTNLASVSVRTGETVAMGAAVGRTGEGKSNVSVELRRRGQPFPIAPIVALATGR